MPKERSCNCGTCKTCKSRERTYRWREKHPEAWTAYRKKWEAANPEKMKASRKRFYEAHAEEIRAEKREQSKKAYWADPEAARARAREHTRRWREANPEKARAAVKRANSSEKAKARRASPEYRMKKAAQLMLNSALTLGLVEKGTCVVGVDCRGRLEAHHADYSKPLEVEWLCSKHHGERHRLSS